MCSVTSHAHSWCYSSEISFLLQSLFNRLLTRLDILIPLESQPEIRGNQHPLRLHRYLLWRDWWSFWMRWNPYSAKSYREVAASWMFNQHLPSVFANIDVDYTFAIKIFLVKNITWKSSLIGFISGVFSLKHSLSRVSKHCGLQIAPWEQLSEIILCSLNFTSLLLWS